MVYFHFDLKKKKKIPIYSKRRITGELLRLPIKRFVSECLLHKQSRNFSAPALLFREKFSFKHLMDSWQSLVIFWCNLTLSTPFLQCFPWRLCNALFSLEAQGTPEIILNVICFGGRLVQISAGIASHVPQQFFFSFFSRIVQIHMFRLIGDSKVWGV